MQCGINCIPLCNDNTVMPANTSDTNNFWMIMVNYKCKFWKFITYFANLIEDR